MQLDACTSPEDFVARLDALSRLPYPHWHDHHSTISAGMLENIEKSLESNQRWSISDNNRLYRQNPAMGSALNILAARINWEYQKHPHVLALKQKIERIAIQMILPTDIIGLILDKIPSDSFRMPKEFAKYEKLSKTWREHVRVAKARWVNTNRMRLHDLDFPSSSDCIRFVKHCGPNLHFLNLVKFQNLTDEEIQDLLASCPNIRSLFLDCYANIPISLETLPSLYNLKKLKIRLSNNFTQIERILTELHKLQKLSLALHPSNNKLPELSPLTNLKTLAVTEAKSLTDIQQISNLTTIKKLYINEAPWLANIPPLNKLSDLELLNIWDCDRITAISSLSGCVHLCKINIWCCPLFTSLPSLDEIPSIEVLHFTQCNRMAELPPLYQLTRLIDVDIWNCDAFKVLPSINPKAPLKKLRISCCGSFFNLPNLGSFQTLEEIHLSYCLALKSISGISELTNLRVLNLTGSFGIRGTTLWKVQQLKQHLPYVKVEMPYDR